MAPSNPTLNYDPSKLERELRPYYIGPDANDIEEMLTLAGHQKLEDLYKHIPDNIKMKEPPKVEKCKSYQDLAEHLLIISKKNHPKLSFLGDGLKAYSISPITDFVCSLRGMTTAYTPYQPERSQGTLYSLWTYSSLLSSLTGMEAINASMYDRSTCLFEALNTASKLSKGAKKILISAYAYPGDIEVLKTHTANTELSFEILPSDPKTGRTDLSKTTELIKNNPSQYCGIIISQVNTMGVVEDFHALTDLCHTNNLTAVGLIDPILLAKGGLVPPSQWGATKKGCTIIIGEAQHLALAPNFGGPGLGLFGVRYNEQDKLSIRSTPGRYIGKGVDCKGRQALTMVLSTREQHIRREKATSNICSNQSFLATIVGANLLARGEKGLEAMIANARKMALKGAKKLTSLPGIKLAFKDSPFFHEVAFELDFKVQDYLHFLSAKGIHAGVDLGNRTGRNGNYILISFYDYHTDKMVEDLYNHTKDFLKAKEQNSPDEKAYTLPENLLRKEAPNLPNISYEEVTNYYTRLNKLNVSPDDGVYPLGSCTMKYNPYINDWAASLQGFTDVHPQAPLEDVQGSLEILYGIQEMFKAITGLPGVTTQPVAGAQGELVGLKLFQAYHNDKKQHRDIILIPKSAHGTNPATAAVAGYDTKVVNGIPYGIVTVNAYPDGQMDMEHIKELISNLGPRIAGIMVTNPNTSGVFETRFKEMADLIHDAGGLVYMDGANMNAIAGILDLDKMGVDAVHNNLHKTWTIPHGGGGPGDAIVAVSKKLIDYLPGVQVKFDGKMYQTFKTPKSIGSFHRHYGNFAHKIRCYTYLKALGGEGIRKMSQVAVLSAVYLYERLKKTYPSLPMGADNTPRMHEFILTLKPETFRAIEASGTPKALTIARVGKLFLDFGLHAPTVAFPEQFGLMIEPTESFTKKELDHFAGVVEAISDLLENNPKVLKTAPHFTPVLKVDEVEANKTLVLSESLGTLPTLPTDTFDPKELLQMAPEKIKKELLQKHQIMNAN